MSEGNVWLSPVVWLDGGAGLARKLTKRGGGTPQLADPPPPKHQVGSLAQSIRAKLGSFHTQVARKLHCSSTTISYYSKHSLQQFSIHSGASIRQSYRLGYFSISLTSFYNHLFASDRTSHIRGTIACHMRRAMPPRSSLTGSFSTSETTHEVVCPLNIPDGSKCRKRCLGVSGLEHI